MKSFKIFLSAVALMVPLATANAQEAISGRKARAVVVPALAGPVAGRSQNSDAFIWNMFVNVVKPVQGVPGKLEFQTWATDKDIYDSPTPVWPPSNAPVSVRNTTKSSLQMHVSGAADVACKTPANPYVAAFPLDGCIASEVRRNRPQFDYIASNGLNTVDGLATYFASGKRVSFPKESLSIKADWVPVDTIRDWIPQMKTPRDVRKFYYTTVSAGVEYGLVAMHLVSKQNPAWVWGTFEHTFNRGRCDGAGCYDSFGAVVADVPPNDQRDNTQYGLCEKTDRLKAIMRQAGIDERWNNFCLKSTQVAELSPSGKPTVMANSVTERISGNGEMISSCMSCHIYASFGATGQPTQSALTMLDYNAIGRVFPSALKDTKSYDYMWGLLNAK